MQKSKKIRLIKYTSVNILRTGCEESGIIETWSADVLGDLVRQKAISIGILWDVGLLRASARGVLVLPTATGPHTHGSCLFPGLADQQFNF